MNYCCQFYKNRIFHHRGHVSALTFVPLTRIKYTFCPECGEKLEHGIYVNPTEARWTEAAARATRKE